jgi:para-nitrobenzyl esterase
VERRRIRRVLVSVAGVITLALCPPTPARTQAAALLTTDGGDIRCAVFTSHTDCLGIPYAAAPVGERRLRAPAPPVRWSGTRDATYLRSACLQAKTAYVKEQQGAEDCLYLNVYKPAKSVDPSTVPVMVWLHGGGFINGSGNAFNGAFLAQTANAIVITVNYRLGPFGWLALPSLAAESPGHSTGNYGLLDSIAALQWVQRNAAAIGGDPKRVTVFGQSAGGEQVLALIASPLAVDLFQRAISMSAPASLDLPNVVKSAASHDPFLTRIDCLDPTTQPDCLRKADAQTMLDAAQEDWDLIRAGGLGWTPTVDGVVLPDQWLAVFNSGLFDKVPVVVGHTREEGRLFVAVYENEQNALMQEDDAKDRSRRFFGPATWLIFWEYPVADYGSAGDQVAQVLVDAMFATGENNDREALAVSVPVYGYQSCDPQAAESHVHARFSKIGCGHDSDLAYLFQWDDFEGREPKFTAEQHELALRMGRYFGNFAATGDPNGTDLPAWSSFRAEGAQVQLLEPSTTGGIRPSAPSTYVVEHRIAFWRRLQWLRSWTSK